MIICFKVNGQPQGKALWYSTFIVMSDGGKGYGFSDCCSHVAVSR